MWRAMLVSSAVVCFSFPTLAPAEDPLPSDARQIVQKFEMDAEIIQREAELKLRQKAQEAIAALEKIQREHTQAGRLDEAVAIRDLIRDLRSGRQHEPKDVIPDPGSLYEYSSKLNQSFYFRVTGRTDGSVWGTGVYTGDSSLATAAVHAGAVKADETRVVKVTILPGQDAYTGSTQNGVTSYSYGGFSVSYRVEATYRPAAIDPGGAAIQQRPAYTVGMHVEVEWGGRWWAAEIITIEEGRYYIHYTGWSDAHNEWVSDARIRPVTPAADVKTVIPRLVER